MQVRWDIHESQLGVTVQLHLRRIKHVKVVLAQLPCVVDGILGWFKALAMATDLTSGQPWNLAQHWRERHAPMLQMSVLVQMMPT